MSIKSLMCVCVFVAMFMEMCVMHAVGSVMIVFVLPLTCRVD